MGFIKTAICIAICAYLSKVMYLYLVSHGVGVHYNNVSPGPCRIVPGINCGSEQISVTIDGLAFITNGYRGLTRCNPKFIKGHLYLFDFNHPEDNVKELKIRSETLNLDSFEPHGMDVYENPEQGVVKVYVVNHADKRESIEVFVYDKKVPDEIKHIKNIVDEKFVCLNDITLIDEDHFYVTNFLKYCHAGKHMLIIEFLFKLKTSNIVYYNDGETSIVAKDEVAFNGITLSKDKSKVLVALAMYKEVFVFDRQPENGRLTLRKKVFVGFGPDNINLDKQSGSFYIGYFKETFGVLMVSMNITEYSSAGGARLSAVDEKWDTFDVKEMFYNNGENFVNAASSFVHYKGQYLLGTIFDRLGYCKDEL